MDGEDWWATVHGVTKSRTQVSDEHFNFKRFNRNVGERILNLKMSAMRCLVAQSCPLFATLWTVACQAPLSTGILQARILE